MRFVLFAAAVLAYALAVGGLQPVGAAFDGLSFVRAAEAGTLDYGHVLYLPLLRAAGVGRAGVDPLQRAQWVSVVGAVLAFALLWRAAEARGASPQRAGLVAAWFGLGTLVWQESGSIEPTSWTLAALLLAARASEAYGRGPSLARLAAALAAFGLAFGFHVVAVCALPWLVARMGPARRVFVRRHAWIVVVAAVGLVWVALLGGELESHWCYWTGFVPRYTDGVVPQLARHLTRGARLLGQGAPVLLLGALLAGVVLVRARSTDSREAAWLALPYLLAFLVFGKPLVALLVPVLLAAALWIAHATAHATVLAGSTRTTAILALGAALELAVSVPRAITWTSRPDEARTRAELFAQHVPAGAVLFAGPLANHVRFYRPALAVVALPELWHQAFARDRNADPLTVVRQAVREAGRPCVLSSEGAGFLVGDLGLDPLALGLSLERALLLPENPKLVLFPLEPGDSRPP